MATKKIKINFKMPTPTAAERLHAQQQKNRKAAGLPDPSEYKKKLDAMKSEEVEHIDESVLKTVKRVFQGWGNDPQGTGTKPKDIVKRNKEHSPETSKKLLSNLGDAKPHTPAGLQKKVLQRNLKSEEVEQLDEISAELKASYVSGAKKQIKQSMPYTKKGEEYRDIAKNFIAKRQKGIAKANEEVEQLDEIGNTPAGRKTLGNYINRSHESGDAARIQATYDKDNFAKHTKTVAKRSSGIAKAVTRLTKEQLEKKGRFVSGPVKQPFKSNTILTSVKEGFKMGRGNIHQYDRNPEPRDGSELENVPFHAKTEKQKKLQSALNDLGKKMKETHPKLKEDTDEDNQIVITKKGTNIKKKIAAAVYNVFKHHGFRKEDADPCWKGYKMVGMKNKNGRQVPNCVPGEGVPSMKKEDAGNPTEGEMKGKQQGVSRKAQIVMNAAGKGKKSDNPDKFQKDPELSSEIHKT